ncbi:hypothetical protein [Chryseobacterium sp. WLY505]|uniref:hypothetical protein n=1 Tax=Chryseobacterium sp. WLY505 TaxID=3068892 RepID=UPI0027966359|nr:hypothetical protein [Chryseobacterium sp. WLY505]MDQ1855735.1 hypothetical protein [Chryseobacterium sp. WLY505]
MKQLEIKTNRRLLIIESESGNYAYDYRVDEKGPHPIKKICKGSDLTEDIAEGLVNIFDLSYYVDYNGHSPRCYVDTALESFISAIEAAGYHWGENPVKEPRMSDYGWYASGHPEEDSGWMYEEGENKYYESLKLFEEAQSRTLNPSKCIIFEIV